MPSGGVHPITNNPWVIRREFIGTRLGAERYTLVNDFQAVGHAVPQLDDVHLRHLCGPDREQWPEETISIIGPGTGLGVAQVVVSNDHYHVLATEGGHVDFAPLDTVEDAILAMLRRRLTRVSVERIVSGPGLVAIHDALAAFEGRAIEPIEDRDLWARALSGSDSLANAALDRFCLSLGAVAGDIALAQGATRVVIAGGLGLRLADHLPRSGFAERFIAKGRFESMMRGIPVHLLVHPEPGLFGAAAAFALEHENH
jgi:glucokinase